MIITKELAKKMDKKLLSEMASEYATEFAHLLGHEGDVLIKPEEVMYDRDEAKKVFLVKYDPNNFSILNRTVAEVLYNDVQRRIKESAFVEDGIAFMPISELSGTEKMLADTQKDIIAILSKANPSNSILEDTINGILMPAGCKEGYVSLFGFSGEIGHMTGFKLYGENLDNGLGESLDISSQLLELSKNISLLFSRMDWKGALGSLILKSQKNFVKVARNQLTLFESLLFESDAALNEKIIHLKHGDRKTAGKIASDLIDDYVSTTHYDGLKIFVESFDSVGGNISRTYGKIGSVLSKRSVKDTRSALKELGYTPKMLARYHGAFGKSRSERADYLLDKTTKDMYGFISGFK